MLTLTVMSDPAHLLCLRATSNGLPHKHSMGNTATPPLLTSFAPHNRLHPQPVLCLISVVIPSDTCNLSCPHLIRMSSVEQLNVRKGFSGVRRMSVSTVKQYPGSGDKDEAVVAELEGLLGERDRMKGPVDLHLWLADACDPRRFSWANHRPYQRTQLCLHNRTLQPMRERFISNALRPELGSNVLLCCNGRRSYLEQWTMTPD